jgi:hypothetical protein
MFKKKTLFPSLLLVLLLLVLGWVIIDRNYSNVEKEDVEQPGTQGEVSTEISLILNFGSEAKLQTQSIKIENDWTAFDALKKALERLDIELATKKYEQGIFIEAIGEKKNGDDNKYWLYYVNGKMPEVSCSKQFIKPGDKIEFKFQTSPY